MFIVLKNKKKINKIKKKEEKKMFYDDDPYADPVNVHDLFVYYNHYFFKDKLVTTFVKWSSRMTLCAGTC